jgi:hypothetical protein
MIQLPRDVCIRIAIPSRVDDGRIAASLRCTCRFFSTLIDNKLGVPRGEIFSPTSSFVFPPASAFALGELVSSILKIQSSGGCSLVKLRFVSDIDSEVLLVLNPSYVDPFASGLSVERMVTYSSFRLFVSLTTKSINVKGAIAERLLSPFFTMRISLLPGLVTREPMNGCILLALIGGGEASLGWEWIVYCLVGICYEGWFLIPAPEELSSPAQLKYLEEIAVFPDELSLHVTAYPLVELDDLEESGVQALIIGAPGPVCYYQVVQNWMESEIEVRAPNGVSMVVRSPQGIL